MEFNNYEEFFENSDNTDDDFDVDFRDSLGYEDSSKEGPKEKRVVKKKPKKEIKVETRKKKKTTTKTKTVKKEDLKDEKPKAVKKVKEDKETKEPVKEKKTVKKEDKKIQVKTKKKKTTKEAKKTKVEKSLVSSKKKEAEELKEEIKEEPKKIEPKKVEKKEEPEKVEPIIEEDEEEVIDDFDEEVEIEEAEEEEEIEVIEPEVKKEKVHFVEEHEESYNFDEELVPKDISEISILKIIGARFKKLFKKPRKYRKQVIISVCVLAVLLIGFIMVKTGFITITFVKPDGETADVVKNDKDFSEYRDTWTSYEEINSDYIGQIVFDSGLIDKPFVQATSCYKDNGVPYKFYNEDGSIVTDFSDKTGNDVYIWMDFETMRYDYDKKGGSVFMDYRNVLSDQNIIIYGHYFSTIYNKDPDRVKSFTPLEKLLEKENYKDNSRVYIMLEDEIRVYDLYAVYKFDSDNDEYWEKAQYFRPNYNVDDYSGETDSDYMKNYIKFIDDVKLYKTNVSLKPGDKTLTLQTCMTPYTNLFEICVFKQVDTLSY